MRHVTISIRTHLTVALMVVAVGHVLPRAQAQLSTEPGVFEVASVKRNLSGEDRAFSSLERPGWVTFTNAELKRIIARAYEVDPYLERFTMVPGVSESVSSARFDIQAKLPEGTVTRTQRLVMLRALLAERFNLRTHTETRQVPIYVMTVAREGRLGASIRPSEYDCTVVTAKFQRDEEPRDINGMPLCRQDYEFNTPKAGAARMSYAGPIGHLLTHIQAFLDRPVMDGTGLSGNFEWVLNFSMRDSFETGVALMPDALEDQLGFKLERRIGPVQVLVIDSVDMPAPN